VHFAAGMSHLNRISHLVAATVGPTGRRRGASAALALAMSFAAAAPLAAQNPAPKDQRTITPQDTAQSNSRKPSSPIATPSSPEGSPRSRC